MNGGPDLNGLTKAADVTKAKKDIAQQGGKIKLLRIKSHGNETEIIDGQENEILKFKDNQILAVRDEINITSIGEELRKVTGPNSRIELRGCKTLQLAKDIAKFLDNGTKVTGYWGYSYGVPFTDLHTGFVHTYSSRNGVLVEELEE